MALIQVVNQRWAEFEVPVSGLGADQYTLVTVADDEIATLHAAYWLSAEERHSANGW